MGKARNWTAEESAYLEEKWGELSIKRIASDLGRSIDAIKTKAQKIGLRDNRFCLDGITLNQLALALNVHWGIVKNWVNTWGFPAKPRVLAISEAILVVRYQDFWRWAEANKQLINLARLGPNALGPEPEWAKEKRKCDTVNFNKLLKRPWSAEDDKKLRSMINAYHYTYPEIARALRRTEAAVKRRLYDLGIKGRPLRLDNHIKYTDEEVKQLVEMFHKGYGYNTIAERLGKSALGIRGKLEQMGYKFRPKQAVN